MNLDAEYDNRARVPEHPAIMDAWRATAEAARAAHPPVEVEYGPGPRHRIDLFQAAPDAPVVLFLHGGYWQALDKSWFSGLAPAFLARGLSLAIPSYDLAPHVPMATIVEQARRAQAATGATVAVGHSAGGHLAACLAAEGRLGAAVAISGLFELEPLIPTRVNDALKLDVETAQALSPRLMTPPPGVALDCVVGAEESDEFRRQSREMAQTWGRLGAATRYRPLPGFNHFTVLTPLTEPHSDLMDRVVELSGVSRPMPISRP